MGNKFVKHFQRSTITDSNPRLEEEIFNEHVINDSTLLSAFVIAVVNNNVGLLKSLLKLGVSVNARDLYEGNTFLHIAIINDSPDIFKFLINRDDIDLNAFNLQSITPLSLAAIHDKKSYVLKLLQKGANANIVNSSGNTALHFATQFATKELCSILLRNGSEINLQNDSGQTPLHLACEHAREEVIYLLLYNGADVLIHCDKGLIPLLVRRVNRLDMNLRVTLYYYTFDDNTTPIDLKILIAAMITKWPLFPKIVDRVSRVIYDNSDLEKLNQALPDFKIDHFKQFFQKFNYVIQDLLQCCVLSHYLTAIESLKRTNLDFTEFLYIFLESDFAVDFIQSRCVAVSPITSLVNIFRKNNFSAAILTQLVCCMLSFGLNVTPNDLNSVYVFYGRCELFEILLHMEIETCTKNTPCCAIYDHEVVQKSILPHFIYDINLDIDKFLLNPKDYLLMDLDVLLDYFALPKLKDFFLSDGEPSLKIAKKLEKLPSVPFLVELARDEARKHIIKQFKIQTSSHFFTVIKWLPINGVYKKILAYEKRLYDC